MHTSSPWDLMLPLSQLVKKSSQSAEAKKMMLKHFAERMPLNHMFYALHHFKSISAINNCLSHLSLNLWLTVFTFSINREFFFLERITWGQRILSIYDTKNFSILQQQNSLFMTPFMSVLMLFVNVFHFPPLFHYFSRDSSVLTAFKRHNSAKRLFWNEMLRFLSIMKMSYEYGSWER